MAALVDMIGAARKRIAIGTAAAVLGAATLAAAPASALPSWSYIWKKVGDQSTCMDRAWSVISEFEFVSSRDFVVDHTTDAVIEVEFRNDDTVAILMCSPKQFTLTVFGSNHQTTQDLRDQLGDLF